MKAVFPSISKQGFDEEFCTIRITDAKIRQAVIASIRTNGGTLQEPINIDFEENPAPVDDEKKPTTPTLRINGPKKRDSQMAQKQSPLTLADFLTALEAAANPVSENSQISSMDALQQLNDLRAILTPLKPKEKKDKEANTLPVNGNGKPHADAAPAPEADMFADIFASSSDAERPSRLVAAKKFVITQITDSQRTIEVKTKTNGHVSITFNTLRNEPKQEWYAQGELIAPILSQWTRVSAIVKNNTITAALNTESEPFKALQSLATSAPQKTAGKA